MIPSQSIADPLAVRRQASRVLRERLGAGRVAYCETTDDEEVVFAVAEDVTDDVASLLGHHLRLVDLDPDGSKMFRQGTAPAGGVQAEDSFGAERKAAFAATCTRAFMLAPVMKSGRLVACLTADFKVPHHWTPAEIRFLEETAERTSAAVERARAEGASQSAQLGRFASAASDVAARPAGPMSGRLVRWRGTPAFLPRR